MACRNWADSIEASHETKAADVRLLRAYAHDLTHMYERVANSIDSETTADSCDLSDVRHLKPNVVAALRADLVANGRLPIGTAIGGIAHDDGFWCGSAHTSDF